MPLTKKIIAVYKDGKLFAEGDNTHIAELFGVHETYVTKRAGQNGRIKRSDGEYWLRYTGERTKRNEEPPKKKMPAMSIAQVKAEGLKLGLDYGYMTAKMEGRI